MAKVLDSWKEFPRVGLVVEGKKKFYSLNEAVPLWDSGFLKVEDTGEVLEEDLSVRKMTEEENREFQMLTDEFSARK